MLTHHHNTPARMICTVALCLALGAGPAFAAPMIATVTPSETQSMAVEITQTTPSVTTEDHMQTAVTVTLTAPAQYVEVRLRLRGPTGRLIYQKTEIRADLPAGRHVIEYDYDLSPLDLAEGRYPIDVRVLATGAEATSVSSRILLVDDQTEALPVAIVVRAAGVPAVTMRGLFTRTPDDDSRLLGDLAFVTQLAHDRRAPIALAVPPVLVEQYARAATGYETTDGGVVPAADETAARSDRMLRGLRSAVATGTVSLIDVPYALPDLTGLAQSAGRGDLDLHWTRTDEVVATALHSVDQPKTAYVGDHITPAALASLASRGTSCVLAPPSALRSNNATATPGCYSFTDSRVSVLVIDERAAAGARSGAAEFYDALFDRLGDGPVIVMLEIGVGDTGSTIAVQHALDWIADAPWLRLAGVDTLDRDSLVHGVAALAPLPDSEAPPEYWPDVVTARIQALAYASAAGTADADAAAAMRAVLAAESSLWAGQDGEWSRADEGRALAQDASDFVSSQFSLITLDAKDVTLSGSRGNVPLTLINNTGKPLHLTLHVTSSSMRSIAASQEVAVQPTQNFLTIPVDLGNALSDDLKITVRAGDVTIAEADVGVQASYIDRLATILMVVVVLAALLVFIRRRVTGPDAATIQDDSIGQDRPDGGK